MSVAPESAQQSSSFPTQVNIHASGELNWCWTKDPIEVLGFAAEVVWSKGERLGTMDDVG